MDFSGQILLTKLYVNSNLAGAWGQTEQTNISEVQKQKPYNTVSAMQWMIQCYHWLDLTVCPDTS